MAGVSSNFFLKSSFIGHYKCSINLRVESYFILNIKLYYKSNNDETLIISILPIVRKNSHSFLT